VSTPSNYIPGVRRRQSTPLYDTYGHALGAQSPDIGRFANTAAANGINVTNMTRSNQLPGTDSFTLQALRIVPVAVTEADWILLVKGMICRFVRGRAVELEAGLEYFSGGAGISTPTAASVAVNNGLADPRAIASLGDNPIVITGGDQFEVHLIGPAAVTTAGALWIRVYLDGYFDKGVQ
jgi:hypothetical protein